MKNIVEQVEIYIQDYVTFADQQYVLPLSLWIIGTFCFQSFDAYPYLHITSPTKRSGKSRLAEMISFCCSNPRNFAALTASTLFRCIGNERPTILFDECESLSSEAFGTMRSVLNVGYRRGQTVPRMTTMGLKEYETYCPKIFVSIGDVFDTLRDRSIVIVMQRAETRKRFTFEAAQNEGKILRKTVGDTVKEYQGDVSKAFKDHGGLPFLMDRDEEIWTSLFCLAAVFCPHRVTELQAAASDMAAEKTGEAKRVNLKAAEDLATNNEYAKKALMDLFTLFVTSGKVISTEDAIKGLKAIPTAPWRKFRGDGITANDLANLLDRFGVGPGRIALGSGRGNQKFLRGYKRADVERAMNKL